MMMNEQEEENTEEVASQAPEKTREQKLDRIHSLLADKYLAVLEDETTEVRASMLATINKFLSDSGVLKAKAEKIGLLEKRIAELEAENEELKSVPVEEVDDEAIRELVGKFLPFPVTR